MKNTKMFKPMIIGSSVVVGVALVLYLSMSVIPRVLVTLTKASAAENVVVRNSYLIGQKILARADGKDTAMVNVFLLDKNGRGVAGKGASLTGMDNVTAMNEASDSDGKITFKITSTVEGQYKVNAMSGGQQLPQTITLTFRN